MLRLYSGGRRLTIRTDHGCFKWILNLADTSVRWARWRLCLPEFEFNVLHRAGVKHQAVDALSRMPTGGADTTPIEDEIPITVIDTALSNEGEITL